MKRRRARRLAVLPALLAFLALAAAAQGRTFVLVISGLGGDPEYIDSFYETGLQLVAAAEAAGIGPESTWWLSEDVERNAARIRARATMENVIVAFDELAEQLTTDDVLWMVLVGHGNFRDGSSKINLPGPDMSDADFAEQLARLGDARIVFVNTTSSSGAFVESLAAPDRVIVTATKSAAQRNETVFGTHFAAAFAELHADEDQDGRVSVLEAFRYANREVQRHYEDDNLLITEHALLDDNGDGEGSRAPDALGGEDGQGDGLLAARLYFAEGDLEAATGREAELLQRRAALQRQLDDLRRQKANLAEDVYLGELERLLVELASLDQELEALRSAEPGGEYSGDTDRGVTDPGVTDPGVTEPGGAASGESESAAQPSNGWNAGSAHV